ncbi:MAG: M81 family metallopeptidase [Hyphomicrobiales bacterium]|nr:M81 family metallopeptidase [Hyphomicrobiales bacterium]
MKLFIAGLDTETNTFAPIPTGRRAFAEGFIANGDATRQPENYCSAQLNVWRRRAEERGWSVAESLCAFAEPGGITVRGVYESFREQILTDLRRALPVDMVLLALHGAMVAEGYDDCEGDILERIRGIVGERASIGAELDLHCHVTDAMVRNATALVAYKEYPHIDIPARAEDLFRIIAAAAEGRTRPVMAAFNCRMISTYRTTEQPLRGFVDRMLELEGRDGIISVSLGHGFPWGDVADVGAKVLVVTDGDRGKAERLSRTLGQEFFAMRDAVGSRFITMDEAIDQALAIEGGPVVIADVSDNAGGGAPGDATFFLRRLIDRGIGNAASGYYWDPMAVRACMEAGRGARFALRIGGKSGVASGDPVDLTVTVMGLADSVTQRFGEAPANMGPTAWVAAEGIDLILTSQRTQVFHPEGMTKLGLDVGSRKLVIVKSTQHFHAAFAPIAKAILYAAPPGALRPDFEAIPYTKLIEPYWPKTANPFEDRFVAESG